MHVLSCANNISETCTLISRITMEESPVSAFAIYSQNRKPAKKPKAKSVAQRLKRKQKKEKSKNIAKQKNNKKESKKVEVQAKVSVVTKINKAEKKKNGFSMKKNGFSMEKNGFSMKKFASEDSDDIPELIAAPVRQFNVAMSGIADDEPASSNCSNLSNDGSFDFTPVVTDSAEEGLKVFKWMIAPYNPDKFLNEIWEKKPLHIARKKSAYYKEIMSTPIIDDMLRNEHIQFTKNIDITSYVGGKRDTHNPEGRAHPHIVWDYYLNGCSIRLLNPQTYIPKLHLMNATLQEFFNSFVGANAYLTPPDSQGFAPHYDDIEAFILQVEGKKHWRIYKPLSENEVLPRVSSKNFDQEEIGEPIMEVTLEAGDMLYFPRGYIHQGVTIDGEHSLHITVSMYQKHSWIDLFEKMIPAALHLAVSENVELRRGLPFDIYDNFGLVNSDVQTPRRKEIQTVIESLFDKLKDHLPIDEAVDQMHKNYQHDALPPVLTDLEKAVTVYGDSDVMVDDGKVTNRVEISLDTKIRLLRKNILRMVSEEEQIRLYYYTENSLEYHAYEAPFLEIDEDLAPAVETLITNYPEYVSVENLEVSTDTDKLKIAEALWERGLVMAEYPLENVEDD